MIDFLNIVVKTLIECFFVAAIFFIPVFIVIWIFGDFQVAVRYSLIVSLIFSLTGSYLDTSSKADATKNSLQDYRKNLKNKRLSGIFVLVSISCLVAYRILNPTPPVKYTISPVVKADTQKPIATSAYTTSYESSCGVIRARYHRAAQKALRGEYVSPSEDVELPARCRY
ncbi:hypothetical protein [Pseudomonas sp. VI4.1]|uniref:hypothetical protein n=1 Tax=Pseudomonas sp. VI4.1 TaxID=1941346 RepID=UPI0010083741|nr:hypothetical protein [Pseudomonas sp. VI4.1]